MHPPLETNMTQRARQPFSRATLYSSAVIFILFGATRIPMMFRSLGEGITSFKEGLEGKSDVTEVSKSEPSAELPSSTTAQQWST